MTVSDPIRRGNTPDAWTIHGEPIPFTGRSVELGQLEGAFARALEYSAPQAVTVLGAPGVGKSRLGVEFLARVRARSPEVRILYGTAPPAGGPYAAPGQLLRERFGLGGLPEDQAQARLRDEVTAVFHDRRVTEVLHFLGSFLGLRFPDNPFIRAMEETPAQFSSIAFSVVKRFFEADAQTGPLLLVIDDLHLAAVETLDLLHFLTDELEGAPVFILYLARTELLGRRGTWFEGEGEHLRLDLGPLPEEDAVALARGMLRRAAALPDEFVDNLVDMTGGNPFHMEQAVRVFVDGGAIDVRGPSWRVNAKRALQIPFPISVEEAVQARLDALSPEARHFLQKAATIGNVFWVGAVEALARSDSELSDDPELWLSDDPQAAHESVISELLESDYVLEIPDSSITGERELCFKHNMEKDLAYRLLGEGQRRRYHLTLAQWLESRIRDSTEEQLEYIARNFAEGGIGDRAARYWLAAGDKARVRYANDKSIEFYMAGLERLGAGDSARRMEALHSLGSVLAMRGESDAAREAFAGMLRIAYTLDLKAKAGAAHNRLGRLARDSGDYPAAMKHLTRGLALFRATDDRRGVAASLDDLGKVFWLRGSYEEALQTMQEGLELRTVLGDPRSIALSQNNIGLVLQDSGDYASALDRYQQALELRRRINDLPGVITSLNNIGMVHQDLGEYEQAIAMWRQAIERCEELGDRRSLAAVLSNLGEAQRKLGRIEEAHEALHRAVQLAQEVGDRLLLCEAYRNLGEVFLDLGDLRMAEDYCGRAMKQAERLGSQVNVGIVARALGEIGSALVKAGTQAEAADAARKASQNFERAIEILQGVGNDGELARSMQTYGRFLEERGDKLRGQRLQERARDLFEGFRRSVSGKRASPPPPPRG